MVGWIRLYETCCNILCFSRQVSLAGNMKKFFKNSILKLNCVCQRIIHECFFSSKIEVGLKEDLSVVSMSNAVENTLSLGTEVAGLPKINIDIVERCRYW